MNTPLISLIIPAHNEEHYIAATLEAIKNNSFTNYEIIVVCDSCDDATAKVSQQYTDTVLSTDYKNPGRSRNLGAETAQGKIIVFCDADTIISENYLQEIAAAYSNGFDYGLGKAVSESASIMGIILAKIIFGFVIVNKSVAGNFFVARKLFTQINGFDENLQTNEDIDIGHRLYKITKKHCYLKNIEYTPSERKFREHGFIRFFISEYCLSTVKYHYNRLKYGSSRPANHHPTEGN